MSLKVEEMDMDNLSENEKAYLRDRQWLPQPPGDPTPGRSAQDWNEDEIESVPLNADGTPFNAGDEDDHISTEGEVDDEGEPIKVDADGNNVGYDWDRMTVPRLKEYLEAYDLPVSGKKAELISRLEEYDTLSAQ